MNTKLTTCTVCLVICLLLVVVGCSRNYQFDGMVVDGDGNPISDAIIVLYPHDWARPSLTSADVIAFKDGYSDEDGISVEDGSFYANWGSAVGVEFFRMIVLKDGYKEHLRIVEADEKNLRIVLEREATP